jgi:hypothetical protein
MASLNTLPPDQRAVLELVLQRGRSYDEIAELLGIDRAGVRQRALSALDALGPQTGVPSERRALITDYLLGALPQRVGEEVRQRLAESPGERAWARVIASELAPIARQPLPEIPVEAAAPARAEERPARRERRRAPEPAAAPAAKPPASRRGGALLLAGAALIVAAVIAALVASSGGSSTKTTSQANAGTTAARTGTGTTAPTTSTNSQVLAQINLNAPTGGKAKGIAEVLRQQGRTGVAIVAQGLVPNTKSPPNAYAVWLYNSPSDARLLGFVNPSVGTNGRLQTAGGFPTNASHFHQLLITLETQSNPKTPGTIVLQGTLAGV